MATYKQGIETVNADNIDSGTLALARIPATLTGKDADTVDGKNPASASGLATLDASSVVVQAPPAHKTAHQDLGSDEISVAGLAGLLADDQHVLDSEVTAVAIPLTQKAAASGVASLNASSLVVQKPADRLSKANFEITLNKLLKGAGAGANPTEIDVPTGNAIIASGSYTGNNSANRAIAHGLGVTPKIIIISRDSFDNQAWILGADNSIAWWSANTTGVMAVTVPDATSFYVGNASSYDYSKNATGNLYYWVAIG